MINSIPTAEVTLLRQKPAVSRDSHKQDNYNE